MALSFTTVADNCWLYGFGFNDVAAWTAGSNTTLLGVGNYSFYTNSAQTPAGSHSLNVNVGGGSFNGIGNGASVAPYVAPAATSAFRRRLLGIGA